MSDWIEWSGGECPVAPATFVDVRFRGGSVCGPDLATFWSGGIGWDWWEHESVDRDYDIIAYRVVAL